MNSEKNYVVNYELLGNRIRELRLEKKMVSTNIK